mgnify:FL=1
MKLLIMGDSWAADWSSQYSEYPGWSNILSSKYETLNLAQAGVSQYSICRQFEQIGDFNFDKCIISITSPYRVYTPKHPVHKPGSLHEHSDLIYTDIEHHHRTSDYNKRLNSAIGYFLHHFDTDQAEFMHELLVDWCLTKLDKSNTIVTSNIADNSRYVKQHTYCNGFDIWNTYPGKINHLSAEGNEVFARNIEVLIDDSD